MGRRGNRGRGRCTIFLCGACGRLCFRRGRKEEKWRIRGGGFRVEEMERKRKRKAGGRGGRGEDDWYAGGKT